MVLVEVFSYSFMIICRAVFVGEKEGDGVSGSSDHIDDILVGNIFRRRAVDLDDSIFFQDSRQFGGAIGGDVSQILWLS